LHNSFSHPRISIFHSSKHISTRSPPKILALASILPLSPTLLNLPALFSSNHLQNQDLSVSIGVHPLQLILFLKVRIFPSFKRRTPEQPNRPNDKNATHAEEDVEYDVANLIF
jgi:hypothetical protein